MAWTMTREQLEHAIDANLAAYECSTDTAERMKLLGAAAEMAREISDRWPMDPRFKVFATLTDGSNRLGWAVIDTYHLYENRGAMVSSIYTERPDAEDEAAWFNARGLNPAGSIPATILQ